MTTNPTYIGHALSKFVRPNRNLIFCAATNDIARQVALSFSLFTSSHTQVVLPGWSAWPFDLADQSPGSSSQLRLEAISEIYTSKKPIALITTAAGLLCKAPNRTEFLTKTISLTPDQELKDFADQLTQLGYTREIEVESPGQFAVRGCVLDVWAIQHTSPSRILLELNRIRSIRTFSPKTQATEGEIAGLLIAPMCEIATNDDFLHAFKDALAFDVPTHNQLISLKEQLRDQMRSRGESSDPFVDDPPHFNSEQLHHNSASPRASLKHLALINKRSIFDELKAINTRTILTCMSQSACESAIDKLRAESIATEVVVCPLQQGFWSDEVVVLTEKDLGIRKLQSSSALRPTLTLRHGLISGGLVIHSEYGIGKLLGIETVGVNGAHYDCFKILYANNDKLFVPVLYGRLISNFTGLAELDDLNLSAWQRRRTKARKIVQAVASDIIKLDASRRAQLAPIIAVDSCKYDALCDDFPHIETNDQLQAMEDVTRDMKSGRAMDRLLCGDVGFGKTEVMLRAVFLCAINGYQAIVLCPTTVLAQQHYSTLSERYRKFGIAVGKLSTMNNTAESKRLKSAFASGEIKVLIATHAAIADDVSSNNIGLIVIDEEQKFGVAQKEKLKAKAASCHVLTVSATPIPRTLQMAMLGLKQFSLISEAPINRRVTKTIVAPFRVEMAIEALVNEKQRGGQSFVVCPRISDIPKIESDLCAALENTCTVAVAHGNLSARSLEKVMVDFYAGSIDVLISTPLVDSGIDVSRANTILIYKCEYFGLAQLYQLRGRVGRSGLEAYAYIFLSKESAEAEERIGILKSINRLGSNLAIASHDLETRGCGNLLGNQQSGQVPDVSIELYEKMLEEALVEMRGNVGVSARSQKPPKITLTRSFLISESYMPDAALRISFYKQISDASSVEDLRRLELVIADRFGPLNQELKDLLAVARVQLLASLAQLISVEAADGLVVFRFEERGNDFALALLEVTKGRARPRPGNALVVGTESDSLDEAERLLTEILSKHQTNDARRTN